MKRLTAALAVASLVAFVLAPPDAVWRTPALIIGFGLAAAFVLYAAEKP